MRMIRERRKGLRAIVGANGMGRLLRRVPTAVAIASSLLLGFALQAQAMEVTVYGLVTNPSPEYRMVSQPSKYCYYFHHYVKGVVKGVTYGCTQGPKGLHYAAWVICTGTDGGKIWSPTAGIQGPATADCWPGAGAPRVGGFINR